MPYLEHSRPVLQYLRGRSKTTEEPLGKRTRKIDKNGPRKGKAVRRHIKIAYLVVSEKTVKVS